MNFVKSGPESARQYPYFPLMVLIHVTSGVLDASVAVILVASALFAVDVNDAKFSILLSLFLTMIPFIALAPTVSLLVEKIKVPRIVLAISINTFRLAILILMAMATSQSETTRLAIFPLAFVMLTLSKCYSVVRTSTLPQITTVESFPFFSSRLAMTNGIVGVVGGVFLFSIYKIFDESATLYIASVGVGLGIVLSVFSYSRLGHRIIKSGIDADFDGIRDKNLGEVTNKEVGLSHRNIVRATKSLFTFISSIRFVVGFITIGIALQFRGSTFMLGACFLASAVASFSTNAFALVLNKSRFSSILIYISAGAFWFASFLLISSSARINFIIFSAVLGAIGAYFKVVYESRIAYLVPQDINAKIFSRGEVIMQLTWVLGATLAVISTARIYLAIVSICAMCLCIWAYKSFGSVLQKTNERF